MAKPKIAGASQLEADASSSQDQQNGAPEAPDSPLFHESAALYPSAPGEGSLAWDWSMSDTFYDPIVQANVDQLVHVRKNCANVVAANLGACRGVQQEAAQLATMLRDATDSTSACVRPLRRGRHYRDVWEEDDFLHLKRKRDAFLGEKKNGFGGQEPLLSNHELVHGYDDELFQRYIGRLEAESRHQQQRNVSDDDAKAVATGAGEKNGGDASDSKRNAKAPPASLTHSVLPEVPVQQWHPAAWGSWTMKKAAADFEEFHPASLSRSIGTNNDEEAKPAEKQQRGSALLPVAAALWGNGRCDTACLPSYGSALEEDEISHAIAASLARLIPLSMLNWRLAQTVYERAGVYAQCSSVIKQEERLSRRIEALYQRMYPPRDDEDEQEERVQAARVPVFRSRRTDLVTHSLKFCRDSEEAQCVAASVEYALTLQVGDEVDVLDRNGCWNDGVVVDVFRESGQVVKFVLLRLSLWDASGSEWVSVTEGRILPRGVADGKTSFMIGPTHSLKRRTEFNRALADTLEKTLSVRHVEQNAAAVERKRVHAASGHANNGRLQKKKAKRAL
ncbi:hypothetical protein PybrP1_011452 [[Pythium] brassicae (nom. inval.)]|nr:hypothetical protein PybrP1_011452 [[Pythium] brassicae (nom. inval.)]